MQLGDFLTAVQHDLPIKIVVAKNNSLGLIKWEQMVFLGNPEYGVNLAPIDFVKFAEACGARGMCITDPRSCADQMYEALSWDGPVIVECLVDQHEPPLPAKVKSHQVQKLTEALVQGTPNRNRIALQMVKDMLDESSFAASPAHAVPRKIGQAAARPRPRWWAGSATVPGASTPSRGRAPRGCRARPGCRACPGCRAYPG
ncbi:UNVERIFIED_ORG: hypothetical protein FHR35_000512 [Microbispora rosea subsp. rosea]